jgi:hypothetical protein
MSTPYLGSQTEQKWPLIRRLLPVTTQARRDADRSTVCFAGVVSAVCACTLIEVLRHLKRNCAMLGPCRYLCVVMLLMLIAVPAVGAGQSEKATVPDAAVLKVAKKLVDEVYGRELAAAKTIEQKQVLAEKFLQLAATNGKDRSSQFVLLQLSRDFASQAADAQIACGAVDRMDAVFQVDAVALKTEVIKRCTATAATAEQRFAIVEKAIEASEQAIGKDDLAGAEFLMGLATSEARKTRDDSLVKNAQRRKAELDEITKAYSTVRKALAFLETNSLDPDSNLVVGKYNCFAKGDWDRGLPMLALGSDVALKVLGEKELKGANSADEQIKLGDAWWVAAQSRKGFEKQRAQRRAEYWYRKSLPQLDGLPKDRIEGRLRSLLQEGLPIYLAELPVEEVRVFDDQAHSVHDKQSFNGRFSEHNLWAHPPSDNSSAHLAYQLDGKFRVLHGDSGIGGQNSPAGSPLSFRILGDGKVLWRSKPVRQPGISNSFRVNVGKVKKLELFVDCPGSNFSAWALWLEPVLER